MRAFGLTGPKSGAGGQSCRFCANLWRAECRASFGMLLRDFKEGQQGFVHIARKLTSHEEAA